MENGDILTLTFVGTNVTGYDAKLYPLVACVKSTTINPLNLKVEGFEFIQDSASPSDRLVINLSAENPIGSLFITAVDIGHQPLSTTEVISNSTSNNEYTATIVVDLTSIAGRYSEARLRFVDITITAQSAAGSSEPASTLPNLIFVNTQTLPKVSDFKVEYVDVNADPNVDEFRYVASWTPLVDLIKDYISTEDETPSDGYTITTDDNYYTFKFGPKYRFKLS